MNHRSAPIQQVDLEEAIAAARIRAALPAIVPGLIGTAPDMQEIVDILGEIAGSPAPWAKKFERAMVSQLAARLTFVERLLSELLVGTGLLDEANYQAALSQLEGGS